MKSSPQGSPDGSANEPAKGLLSRLALAKRKVAKTTRRWRVLLGGGNPETSASKIAEPDWQSLLRGEMERECPAKVFRHLSSDFRKADDLDAAERICSRGVAAHPDDLWLAMEHAHIASVLDDPELMLERWQRVIDVGGGNAPSKAFKNLADCHRHNGDFENAAAVIRRGTALHPDDFHLAERLAKFAIAAGFSDRAIAHLRELIANFPEANLAMVYRQISEAFLAEGMLDRAEDALNEGILKFPEELRLREAKARLLTARGNLVLAAEWQAPSPPAGDNESIRDPAIADFTAHLFGGRFEPFGQGVVSIPIHLNEVNQHLPAMLDFAECISPLREPYQAARVDVFTTWGATDSPSHNLARELAAAHAKPLLCIEYGFISSLGLAINNSPQHSIIICPDSIYFDATRPSFLESRLNSSDYQITGEQQTRVENCISNIVRHRITKYNHAPQTDLSNLFPANGRKRILLVDQRFGDNSVEKGLGSERSFQRMLEAALRMPDHDIIFKLHPDAISGGQGSYLGRLVPKPLPRNITVIDFDVNPFCLFEVVDKVFVCTSQFGFEALMAGKEVHCFGVPFYAGWGLTHDRMAIPRRNRARSLHEIFQLFYIEHSRYFSPTRGVADLEDLIDYLVESKASEENHQITSTADVGTGTSDQRLKILIILPSGRLGASGRYIQNLGWSLCQLGCRVMVLAEGSSPPTDNGVRWLTLEFEGNRLAPSVRETITAFAPDIIYENGVRSRAQRAALEAMVLTNARFAMQSEDDDVQVFETHHGKAAADALTLIDMPTLAAKDIARFLQHNNWRHSLNVLLDPEFDRWVEPLLRVFCYRLASLHTAIWQPFAERLAREYAVPTMVVPPVASAADFERLPISPDERGRILRTYGIGPNHVVIFIGGALYSYSDEYAIFLDALNLTFAKTGRAMALVVTSSRSSLPVARMARERLLPGIAVADLGRAEDTAYMEMLKACDVVCSPGLPDSFNRFRLPSRLVKAMAMGKAVLTCRCGFGESLENGVNAFLTDGAAPADWAETLAACLDDAKRADVGNQGVVFAREHFDSDRVAAALKQKFEAMLTDPANPLADGILHGATDPEAAGTAKARALAGIKLRNRYHSTMQDAIHLVAARCNHLGTVVHIGAGRCAEFDAYCRLGAERIVLIEALPDLAARLRKLENFDGRIVVQQAVVAATRGSHPAFQVQSTRTDSGNVEELSLLRPTRLLKLMPSTRISREEELVSCVTLEDICYPLALDGSHNILLLELNGHEASALATTPAELLRKFQWIALRVSDEPLYENAATSEQVTEFLTGADFQRVTALPNYSDFMQTALFRRGELPSP